MSAHNVFGCVHWAIERKEEIERKKKSQSFHFMRLPTMAQASDRHLATIRITKVANDTEKLCALFNNAIKRNE